MDRIERWTQQWLDDRAGAPADWTIEGEGRPLALDRAESVIRRPPAFRSTGPARADLLRRRHHAEGLLAACDGELRALVDRRRALLARIEACNLGHRRHGAPLRRT